MGTGCRVFFLDDKDSLERIPMAWLNRLLRFDRKECLPQYSGKRVRCAMVFVDVAGSKVLAIQDIQYSILAFDARGRLDKKEWERGMRLGMELVPPLTDGHHPKQIIDAHHRFAKRRYEHEFKWKPNRKVEAAIVAAIFRQ